MAAYVDRTVRESATGLPMYARLSIAGLPQGGLFSDPVTGAYTVSLLIGETYSFNVTAVAPNYQAAARSVTVGATQPAVDFELEVDAALCSVPGYAPSITERLSETFDADTAPAGWTIYSVDLRSPSGRCASRRSGRAGRRHCAVPGRRARRSSLARTRPCRAPTPRAARSRSSR